MPKLIINNNEVEVEEGLTVMQACQSLGIEIPHFCYHEKLKIAGNCRMCLVEMERAPKPIASCATNVAEGMKIYTESPKVTKAREGVMEFLLINHPLDCPICDQGGECDLQDQAFKYGKKTGRFSENKRSVEDKNLGPLIATSMNRCIHCTRCIRFSTDVAGVTEMGAVGRGENMEVTTYLQKSLTSELSGNMIDLCPVGALTSKPYSFTARSWEMKKTESIDIMDAVGSNIRIDSRAGQVMRILPRTNEQINEEWISDKARFSYDGLRNQRLDVPYIRIGGILRKASWQKAITLAADKILSASPGVGLIAGFLNSCEPMFLLKKLFALLKSKAIDANQLGYKIDNTSRGNYLFNTTIAGVEKADLCLMVGVNTRKLAPVLNARIGKMVRDNALQVANIGDVEDQTYKIEHLGSDPNILNDILSGKHDFSKKLSFSKKPLIIIGEGVYGRSDGYYLQFLLQQIAQKYSVISADWNGYNILHKHANIVGALDLGLILNGAKNSDISGTDAILKATRNKKINVLYLLGADEINMADIAEDCFVIYQGHHGDKGAERADIILPEAAYTEQDGMYVNLEGRVQRAKKAIEPPGEARPSIKIILDIAKKLELPLHFEDLVSIRSEMARENSVFSNVGNVAPAKIAISSPNDDSDIMEGKIVCKKNNYYMDNVICNSSVTMAKCSRELLEQNQGDM